MSLAMYIIRSDVSQLNRAESGYTVVISGAAHIYMLLSMNFVLWLIYFSCSIFFGSFECRFIIFSLDCDCRDWLLLYHLHSSIIKILIIISVCVRGEACSRPYKLLIMQQEFQLQIHLWSPALLYGPSHIKIQPCGVYLDSLQCLQPKRLFTCSLRSSIQILTYDLLKWRIRDLGDHEAPSCLPMTQKGAKICI